MSDNTESVHIYETYIRADPARNHIPFVYIE